MRKHQDNFEAVKILKPRATHQKWRCFARDGAMRQRAGHRFRIASYVDRGYDEGVQGQAKVLREHNLGQQVIADVTKSMENQQAQQQTKQPVTPTHTAVSEVDKEGHFNDFQGSEPQHQTPGYGEGLGDATTRGINHWAKGMPFQVKGM